MKRPPKHPDILKEARRLMGVERFLDTRHAVDRKLERSITLSEIRHVIAHVFHEKRKDEFKEDWNAWNYAIRGKYLGAS